MRVPNCGAVVCVILYYYSVRHLSSVCVGRHLDLCGRALQTEKADPLDHYSED
ncbi:hypothetical protein B296_00024031 [Ensete ventricosum]|uniref:Uncharacterized protein n=1 Tax=Ensete ventricosum TaxID=4639 RepID=A0A426X9Q1_ENSVE|nr:hypothetical protein B296_00024031 [Ensete ventricosum]